MSEQYHSEELEVPTADAVEQTQPTADEPADQVEESYAPEVTDEPTAEAADDLPLGDEVAEECDHRRVRARRGRAGEPTTSPPTRPLAEDEPTPLRRLWPRTSPPTSRRRRGGR